MKILSERQRLPNGSVVDIGIMGPPGIERNRRTCRNSELLIGWGTTCKKLTREEFGLHWQQRKPPGSTQGGKFGGFAEMVTQSTCVLISTLCEPRVFPVGLAVGRQVKLW